MRTLYDNQLDSLKHIHVSVDDPEVVWHFDSVHTLDLLIPSYNIDLGEHLQELFISAFKNPNLERLCIIACSEIATLEFSLALRKALESGSNGPLRNDTLREVTLHGIELGLLQAPLVRTINFDLLTHLTLWDCWKWYTSVDSLAKANPTAPIRLKHFGLCFNNVDLDIPEIPERNKTLGSFLSRCTELHSLCLQWQGFQFGKPLMDAFVKIGPKLRILSLHYKDLELYEEEQASSLPARLFDLVCRACPNVQQLGYQLAGLNHFQLTHYEDEEGPHALESISRLRHLKVLHLRQTYYGFKIDLTNPLPAYAITFRLQHLANHIFSYLSSHAHGTTLQALIIGEARAGPQDDEMEVVENQTTEVATDSVPQHCYVKGQQTGMYVCVDMDYIDWEADILGRRTTVAAPVPSYQLRHEIDDTEIMDWHTNWTPHDYWMCRLPGRFHDD